MDAQVIKFALYDLWKGCVIATYDTRSQAEDALETELDYAARLWKEGVYSSPQEARDKYAEDLKMVKLQFL